MSIQELQKAYADTKAECERIDANVKAQINAAGLTYDGAVTHEQQDAVYEQRDAIREASGYWDAHAALMRAERDMVAMGVASLGSAIAENCGMSAKEFLGRAQRSVTIWNRLVALVFKVA